MKTAEAFDFFKGKLGIEGKSASENLLITQLVNMIPFIKSTFSPSRFSILESLPSFEDSWDLRISGASNKQAKIIVLMEKSDGTQSVKKVVLSEEEIKSL